MPADTAPAKVCGFDDCQQPGYCDGRHCKEANGAIRKTLDEITHDTEVATIRAEAHAAGWLAARDACVAEYDENRHNHWDVFGTALVAIRALAPPPEVADVLARVRKEEREALCTMLDDWASSWRGAITFESIADDARDRLQAAIRARGGSDE